MAATLAESAGCLSPADPTILSLESQSLSLQQAQGSGWSLPLLPEVRLGTGEGSFYLHLVGCNHHGLAQCNSSAEELLGGIFIAAVAVVAMTLFFS